MVRTESSQLEIAATVVAAGSSQFEDPELPCGPAGGAIHFGAFGSVGSVGSVPDSSLRSSLFINDVYVLT